LPPAHIPTDYCVWIERAWNWVRQVARGGAAGAPAAAPAGGAPSAAAAPGVAGPHDTTARPSEPPRVAGSDSAHALAITKPAGPGKPGTAKPAGDSAGKVAHTAKPRTAVGPKTKAARDSAKRAPSAAPKPAAAPAPPPEPARAPRLAPRLSTWAEVALTSDRAKDADLRGDRYMVEVHKKWAIATACIPFVLLGIALALRFPRGGMGLVIGGGFAAFSIYYIGLTAGEALADRGFLSPLLAMWLPNMILTVVGLIGLAQVNRQPGLNRGGDFRELFDAMRWKLRRLRRRSATKGSPTAEAAA
jgi:lipopolysaccharide export system permease protein